MVEICGYKALSPSLALILSGDEFVKEDGGVPPDTPMAVANFH
jgi:hypothetical protein